MKLHYAFLPALLVAAALTSCSDDDDTPDYVPAVTTDITENINVQFAQALEDNGVVRNADMITYGDVRNVKMLKLSGNPLTSDGKLTSLQGIEYFTSLEILEVDNNALTSVDLRYNHELETLKIQNNALMALDLGGCPDLEYLYCGRNNIGTLDLSRCDDLIYVDCSYNALTSINLRGCDNISSLYVNSNMLTSVDITPCRVITAFGCDANPGAGGVLKVHTSYTAQSLPAGFTTGSWTYQGNNVTVDYIR
ncbi:MAG: hypothetical protein NC043_01425 [Muribaculaceae bacterium]|nr:hypothetical protein [Muribaculaceae bacterium]